MAALTVEARFVDPEIEKAPVVQVKQAAVPGKADSLLPRGKTWKLVWHDEFDGAEIDKTKWMCRESFWGQDFPAFAHNFEGVEMTGERTSRPARSRTTFRRTPPDSGRSARTASRSS